MNQKVVFVEPKGVEANVFAKQLSLPLMGNLYLGTIMHNSGYDVKIYNENILKRNIHLSELDADVLCLTSLTSTANRAYDLARQYKAANPKGRVIMGGIHASYVPEEAEQFVDHVVIGEGENVIRDLIEYGSSEKFIHGERVADLDSVPMPNFDLLMKSRNMRIWPLIASRGCPHNCKFCCVTKMFGRKYRMASIDRVMEEIEQARVKDIFFYDDNFAANSKRTHELLDRILASGQKLEWYAQVRADVTRDPELVRKMRRAGCARVFIGFESINPETLKSLNKGQDVEEITRSIKVFHDNGIGIHGMFIFGSDEDTPDVFNATCKFCKEHDIDTVQFMALTPIPGTEVFQEVSEEGRLLHKMWQYYDGMHAVHRPKNMSPEVLQQGMIDAFDDFYSLTRTLNEGLNEAYYTASDMVRRIMQIDTRPYRRSALLKGLGVYIVNKWKWLNADYTDYLRKIQTHAKPSILKR